ATAASWSREVRRVLRASCPPHPPGRVRGADPLGARGAHLVPAAAHARHVGGGRGDGPVRAELLLRRFPVRLPRRVVESVAVPALLVAGCRRAVLPAVAGAARA